MNWYLLLKFHNKVTFSLENYWTNCKVIAELDTDLAERIVEV